MSTYYLYTDGSACPNPGRGGAGAVVLDSDHNVIKEESKFLHEEITNNQAEYGALRWGLTLVPDDCTSLHIKVDSDLVNKQLTGKYKVQSSLLRPLFNEVNEMLSAYDEWSINHIPRHQNSQADRLAKKGVKQGP